MTQATLAFAVMLLGAASPVARAADYYVAVGGSDRNNGTKAKPFATITRARDEVRKRISKDLTSAITVWIRGGTYRLANPIELQPADSGTKRFPVTYAAFPGETPVLSGGKTITRWKPAGDGRWQAAVEDLVEFRQLYVDGRRLRRARGDGLPDARETGDLKTFDGESGYLTKNVAMAGWRNPGDVELGYFADWTHTICKVADIRRTESGQAFLVMQQPGFFLARHKEGKQARRPDYVENALELLDQPGEWYFDRTARTVYVKPYPRMDLTAAEVVAPRLERLLEVRGTVDRPVEDIRFEGLTFAEAGWLRPSREGHADVQSNFVPDPKRLFLRKGLVATVGNETLKTPANVVVAAGRRIRFEGCTFTRLGGAGLDIEQGSQDNAVTGCHFHDIAASGVQVGDVLEIDHHPKDARWVVRNNSITNNYFHDVGVEYLASAAVFAGYTDGTLIAHNEMSDIAWAGVAMGWGWGEQDPGGGKYEQPVTYSAPSAAKNNRIEANHIHLLPTGRTDAGGIYMLGAQPGTVIVHNVIHDVIKRPTGFPNGGIYLDEGSAFMEVRENIVYDSPKAFSDGNEYKEPNKKSRTVRNFFDVAPTDPGFPKEIAEAAGLEAPYRKLLEKKRSPP